MPRSQARLHGRRPFFRDGFSAKRPDPRGIEPPEPEMERTAALSSSAIPRLEPALRARSAAQEAPFEQEALPHQRALFGTAYRLTRNAADAEDLVQETCLRAYRAWHTYTPGTNVRAWLYTILYRARLDSLRKRGRSPRTVELTDDGPPVTPCQDAYASGYEELNRALLALPERFRAAVVLRDVEDLSYDEIARALGVPIGTVMSRIHRGRALLRSALAPGS